MPSKITEAMPTECSLVAEDAGLDDADFIETSENSVFALNSLFFPLQEIISRV